MARMKSAAAVVLLALVACARPAARVPGLVKVEAHLGADPALHLIAPEAKVVAVVIPQAAGRIVHYSLDGENILYNPQNRPAGGYGRDPGPERTIPPHPAIWTGKHTWATLGDVV